jgi:thioredoxin-dependent peroxiredoxin
MAASKTRTGAKAPDFTLPDADGNRVSLKEHRGSWVLLYFYPRDNTSGCTTEAVDFTSRLRDFKALGAEVIGISPDSAESHRKFIDKHGLGITLLSDTGRTVVKRYGAWQIKKMYGKESYGVVRSTFLIDPSGIIRQVWEKVRVAGHADDVVKALETHIG